MHSADDDSNDVTHATIVFTRAIFVPKIIIHIDQLLGWVFSAAILDWVHFIVGDRKCGCGSQYQVRITKVRLTPTAPKNGELAKLTPAVFSVAE